MHGPSFLRSRIVWHDRESERWYLIPIYVMDLTIPNQPVYLEGLSLKEGETAVLVFSAEKAAYIRDTNHPRDSLFGKKENFA